MSLCYGGPATKNDTPRERHPSDNRNGVCKMVKVKVKFKKRKIGSGGYWYSVASYTESFSVMAKTESAVMLELKRRSPGYEFIILEIK